MYVQTVSFGLDGTSESKCLDTANEVASRYSSMPGLLAKPVLEVVQARQHARQG